METIFKKESSNTKSSIPHEVQEVMEGIRSNFLSSMQDYDYIPLEVVGGIRKRKK